MDLNAATLLEFPKTKHLVPEAKLIEEKRDELFHIVQKIQKNCKHSNQRKNFEKSENPFSERTKFVESKTCLDCGHLEWRPDKGQHSICYLCWGKMEFICNLPGQGGDGGSMYKCTLCKHEEIIY